MNKPKQVYFADWSNKLLLGEEISSTDKDSVILHNKKFTLIDSSRVFATKHACCLFILQQLRAASKSIAENTDIILKHLEDTNEPTHQNHNN